MTQPLANVTPIAAAAPDDGVAHIERILAAEKGPADEDWKLIQAAYRARFEDETCDSLEEGLGVKPKGRGASSYAVRLREARRLRALGALCNELDLEDPTTWKAATVLLEAVERFTADFWRGDGWEKRKEPPAGASALRLALFKLMVEYGEDGPPGTPEGMQGATKRLRELD